MKSLHQIDQEIERRLHHRMIRDRGVPYDVSAGGGPRLRLDTGFNNLDTFERDYS